MRSALWVDGKDTTGPEDTKVGLKKKWNSVLGTDNSNTVRSDQRTYYHSAQTLIPPLLILLLPVLPQNKSLTLLCVETSFTTFTHCNPNNQ